MGKMMKQVNRKVVNHGSGDMISTIFRISKQSATDMAGIEVSDAEIVNFGIVFRDNNKFFLQITADTDNQIDAIASDLLNGII